MTLLKLVNLDEKNWEVFCAMYPGEDGANYVSSNGFSFAQSFFEKDWIIKGITFDGKPVGFTMFGLDKANCRYELCRLMFDYREQGKGFGKQVLPIIIEDMKKHFNCREIFLSTSPQNKRAIHLYELVGFKKTNEIIDDEIVFKLSI